MTTSNRTAGVRRAGGWVAAGLAIALAAGCNTRPPVPTTASGEQVKTVAVAPNDAAEAAAVANLLETTAGYRQALSVIHAYYVKTGALDKQLWAERELNNLEEARPWGYEGVPASPEPPAQSVENVPEATLAERVVSARRAWKEGLARLADLYRASGASFKLALIRNVQQRFDPVHAYDYFLTAEIPPATLRPTEVVPAANDLFARALKLHKQGKPLPAITDYPKQRQALLMFLELVGKYPASTKIAESAYYIGDIYKEYFNENVRAVQWYERAWQWDPSLMLPARSQAAFVYDFRLGQHGKALPLYYAVIKYEQYEPSRVRYAYQRIDELTKKTQ